MGRRRSYGQPVLRVPGTVGKQLVPKTGCGSELFPFATHLSDLAAISLRRGWGERSGAPGSAAQYLRSGELHPQFRRDAERKREQASELEPQWREPGRRRLAF